MKLVISILLLLGSVTAFAQKTAISFGDIYFESYEYREAIASYKKALTDLKDPSRKQYVYSQLSLCYSYLFQYAKAEEYFDLALNSGEDVSPSLFIEYGKVLKTNGKYAEAKRQFRLYNEITFTNEASQLIRSVDWAMANANSVNNYSVFLSNLDVSGQGLGYCFYGQGLIYCHGRNKPKLGTGRRAVFDLDYAISENNLEFVGRNNFFPNIQFDLNEISPCLSKDETQLYFAANAAKLRNGVAMKGGLQSDKYGVSNYKIYVAEKKDAVFQNPRELSFNNLESNYMHPCISEDGRMLVFSSDRPGGYGGFDLYKSVLSRDSTWSEPVNLGAAVNTSENELFPWVTGGLLFFSSKGFNGYGGYDIYIAELDEEMMPRNLKNMGKPINSFRDDVAFMSADSGATGYFSSNRGREDGADEVYFFRENRLGKGAISLLAGITDTSITGMNLGMNVPLPVNVSVTAPVNAEKTVSTETKNNIPAVPIAPLGIPVVTATPVPAGVAEPVPDNKPKPAIALPDAPVAGTPVTPTVSIPVASAAPVLVETTSIAPVPVPDIKTDIVPVPPANAHKEISPVPSVPVSPNVISTVPVHVNEKESKPAKKPVSEPGIIPIPGQLSFPHILFKFNDVHITGSQAKSADSAAAILKAHPSLKLDVRAYTDSRGRRQYNQVLSEKRAAAVRNYMIQKGIAANRISAKGFGETRLLNECADGVVCSQEKHAVNRRVEIKVLE